MKNKLLSLFQQVIKFGLVGVSNTFISLAVYYLLVYFGCHYLIANTIGFIVSVVNSYFWNSKFVFKNKKEKNSTKAFIKMFLSYLVTFLLSTILMKVLVDVLDISKLIAPLLCLCITIPLNFVLNKIWAFKDK